MDKFDKPGSYPWKFLYWDEEDNSVKPEPDPFPINEKKTVKCSKCGVEFDYGPILYSCNKNGCPLFPQTMC